MNRALVCVGKLREKCLREAADEYIKRLGRYGGIEEIELPDEAEPAKPTPALEEIVKRKEGERILRALRPNDTVIVLCVDAVQYTSPDFSAYVSELAQRARGRVVFVIGGSLGLSEAVLRRADGRISLSKMTFPHGIARILLLEQLYRAAKIAGNERYHK